MTEFVIHSEIGTWDEKWKLSALLKEDKTYHMPSITNNSIEFYADNPTWIIEELLVNLKYLLQCSKLEVVTTNLLLDFKQEFQE